MESKRKIVIFITFLFLFVYCLFLGVWFDEHFMISSPDVEISDVYLCRMSEGECSIIENNTFSSNEFGQIAVCGDYSSSQSSSISFFISYPEGTAFGSLYEVLDKGTYEICYNLEDATDIWNTSFAGEYPSPVENDSITSGQYVLYFEQGRDKLTELHFKVVP